MTYFYHQTCPTEPLQALRLYCLKRRRWNPVIRYDVYISGLCIIIIFNEIIELVPNFLKVYTFTCMSSTKIKKTN